MNLSTVVMDLLACSRGLESRTIAGWELPSRTFHNRILLVYDLNLPPYRLIEPF